MPASALVLHAPAKVNLALHVVGRRGDGFHALETLAVFADRGDRIEIAPAAADGLAVTGPRAAGVPANGANLVARAREALRAAFPERAGPVAIRLTKNLPPASGIGGGSSDAAATLKGLAALWGIDADALPGIGAAIGADVPMCLAARPLVARGIGERLELLAPWPALDLVLANPGVAVATPAVFARLGRRDNPGLPPLPSRRAAGDVTEWLAGARNDLEPAAIALAPEIAAALDALDRAGAGLARMSGSGATCFGIFAGPDRTAAAAAAIAARHPGWYVTAAQTTGPEP